MNNSTFDIFLHSACTNICGRTFVHRHTHTHARTFALIGSIQIGTSCRSCNKTVSWANVEKVLSEDNPKYGEIKTERNSLLTEIMWDTKLQYIDQKKKKKKMCLGVLGTRNIRILNHFI